MTIAILLLIAGLVALVVGGDLLVRGAVGLAEKASVTPLIIGLVIVGLGTSMPELVASIEAALAGAPDIAWGNIVGSNISNSLLILGLSAAVTPIIIGSGSAVRDPAIAFAATLLLFAIGALGIGHWSFGVAMIVMLGLYIAWCYREERQAAGPDYHSGPHDRAAALEMTDPGLHSRPLGGWTKPVLLTLIGLAVLVGGGRLLVTGAIDIARLAGLSETLIGLTIIAIGTSLPELVTSLIAAMRKQAEVAFGNVVGSNIFNVLGIGGVTMAVAPGALPETLLPFDMAVMAASALIILIVGMTTKRFGRLLGLGLFSAYVAFLAYLFIGST